MHVAAMGQTRVALASGGLPAQSTPEAHLLQKSECLLNICWRILAKDSQPQVASAAAVFPAVTWAVLSFLLQALQQRCVTPAACCSMAADGDQA